ncbi:helix-turn-helix transcriptional regulator [Qipengyuania spongiae]|uniref:HTH luxR-type domain-containing protein n=1 Tax=Qipengyuania spongiae TaxID=2909673 RepID=A0ABY5SWK1_9SPHN|nr:hypothetical protein [Qipengyuania spongiae]UVI38918.1 hypothetical protein L1F33_11815 [Qipengyuania spongiae]
MALLLGEDMTRSAVTPENVARPSHWPLAAVVSVSDNRDRHGGDALESIAGELAQYCGFEGTLVEWIDPHHAGSHVVAEFGCAQYRARPAGSEDAWCSATDASAEVHPKSVGSSRDDCLVEADFPVESGRFVLTNWIGRRGSLAAERSRKRFSEMLPLLSILFRTVSERTRLKARNHGFAAAIQHSDVATLILDQECRIAFANKAAELIMSERDGIRQIHGKLASAGIGDTLRLQSAVQHLVDGDREGAEPSPVIAIKRPGRRPLLIGLVQAPRAGELIPVDTMAIAYVFDPEQNLSDIIEPVCRFYGLSPNETRLTCGLVEGRPLCDVAKSISIREQTARSYLKQIFAKTETNRQAELVQLLLRSSIRMATFRKICAFS